MLLPLQVFGPVTKPLYALRYGGPRKLEGVVEVGAPVMAVQQRAVFVNAAEAQRPVRSAVLHSVQGTEHRSLAIHGHVWVLRASFCFRPGGLAWRDLLQGI